jgi:hypothetical protein
VRAAPPTTENTIQPTRLWEKRQNIRFFEPGGVIQEEKWLRLNWGRPGKETGIAFEWAEAKGQGSLETALAL